MSFTIVESEMTFGPFSESECFPIEKCPPYTNLGDGVKMVEFVLNRSNSPQEPFLLFVEAKHSSPRPENQMDFSEFISEISEKMINGVSLFFAAILKRHGAREGFLVASMHSIDLSRCKVRCILVIHGHAVEWLPPIQDALRKSLLSMNKTWNFGPNAVVVLNEALAADYPLLRAR
ncbi:MAG: hypothetical protein JEY71_12130 [Sphaerochaeta sp.]|nr:hypothetical protein [Sphaerochaeta sp.]